MRLAKYFRPFFMATILALLIVPTTAFPNTSSFGGNSQLIAVGDAMADIAQLDELVQGALNGKAESFSQLVTLRARVEENLKRANLAQHPGWIAIDKGIGLILDAERSLKDVAVAVGRINENDPERIEATGVISATALSESVPRSELFAIGKLEVLAQRIVKNVNLMQSRTIISADVAFLTGKDAKAIDDLTQGLLLGSEKLDLRPAKNETKKYLLQFKPLQQQLTNDVRMILNNLSNFAESRHAAALIARGKSGLLEFVHQALAQ